MPEGHQGARGRMGEPTTFAECKTKNRKPKRCGCCFCVSDVCCGCLFLLLLLFVVVGGSIYASFDVCNPKVKPNRQEGAASSTPCIAITLGKMYKGQRVVIKLLLKLKSIFFKHLIIFNGLLNIFLISLSCLIF